MRGHSETAARQVYRPEIDGLRALAVVAVMLCHAGIPGAEVGYLGVDVFFAISGYLMAGVVVSGEVAGGLSLARFYLRRVRRVLPALLAVMAVCTIAAWLLLVPDLLENFGQSLVATALMANNVLLLQTGGYWDLTADFKPLMHTWSLGVEEQFYLLGVPAMLLLLRRGGTGALGAGLVVVTLASLGLAAWLEAHDPSARFLLLPTRVWELTAGSLALVWRRPGHPLVAAGGLALAAIGLAGGLQSSLPVTALAVGGTAVWLATADARRGTGRIFAARIPVALGLVSYGAYLIHQPLLAFVRLLSLERPGPGLLALALIPVFPLAWLSWRWLEQPCRDRTRINDRTIVAGCAGASAALAALGLVFHFSHGFAMRWPEISRPELSNIAYVDAPRRFAATPLDPTARDRNLVVFGHSYARDVINMGLESGRLDPRRIHYVEDLGPESVAEAEALGPSAASAIIAVSASAERLPWLREVRARLQRAGYRAVVVMGPKQFAWSNSAVMRLPEAERRAFRAPVSPAMQADDRALARGLSGHYASYVALLGQGKPSLPVFTPNGQFVSQDGHHLTPAGARWLGGIAFAAPPLAGLPALAPGGEAGVDLPAAQSSP